MPERRSLTKMNIRANPEWEEKQTMKTWTKPAVSTIDAGFEVTRYLPSTLDLAAKRSCKK
jgi:coenzyme PQQ precursor peptide PqqA